MQEDSLDPPINQNVTSNAGDKAIKSALKVIEKNYSEKNQQDDRNRMIQDLFEVGFTVASPQGTKKINSKMLYQSVWRTANRMKPLDFAIHGVGASEDIERIVTQGVGSVMDMGGYVSSLRDKQGSFFSLLMYGDGYISIGANPKKGPPILFNPIGNDNLYVDTYTTGFRWRGWGREATKAVAIFSYSWAEFVDMYPGMKTKAGLGRIPREFGGDHSRELFRNRDGAGDAEKDDLVEVAHAYDLNAKNYVVFAGAQCTKIFERKGNDYDFVLNDEQYIPILNYICMPSADGFYNHGIGAMIYDLALISQRLLNMELGHIEDNTYPIELVNVAQEKAAIFLNRLRAAHEMRAAGKKAYVVMERDSNDPNAAAVQSQTLLTQNLFNEWQMIFDRLTNELKRMGIVLDEVERGPNITATQIMAEEENANSFVKQIMEYNASESKFAVDITMDFIKKFVTKRNQTSINLTTKIPFEEGGVKGEVSLKGMTLGHIADELKSRHYFTKINARTGAIPSNTLRGAQVARGIQFAPPGSPAYIKLMNEFAAIHDLDVKGEEFAMQQQPTAGPEGEVGKAGRPLPTETDRLSIRPGRLEPEAVL